MKFLKILLFIISIIAAILLVLLLFFELTEYRPSEVEILDPIHTISGNEAPGGLRIMSWNLGYCGLDENMDFFMEGGETTTRAPLANQHDSLDYFIEEIGKQDPDVYFIQEVDTDSRRSFHTNQLYTMSSAAPKYEACHAINFKSPLVPVPVKAPIGKVESGIATFSRYSAIEAKRYQLPGEFSWPVRIFHLKRCILVSRIPSPADGKDWYLINTHLTAYGDGGQRKQQLDFLKKMIEELYAEGHYIVVGGDWNSLFPGVTVGQFGDYTTPEESLFWLQNIPEGWTPENWQWCYDSEVPTARTLERPFTPGENLTCIIDGFLVSPNLRVDEVQGFNLKFTHSDHNPVAITVSIRK